MVGVEQPAVSNLERRLLLSHHFGANVYSYLQLAAGFEGTLCRSIEKQYQLYNYENSEVAMHQT